MTRRTCLAIVTLVLAAIGVAAAPSPPQVRDAARPTVGTGQIAGTVVSDEAAPAPLRRVTMTLVGEFSGLRAVAVTDDEGRFAFTSLPADRYALSAAKAAYLPWNYGSRRAGGSGTPVVVTDGQQVSVSMTLYRGSVLSGTIRDEQGAPLANTIVTALRYGVSTTTGERQLQSVRIGSAQTFTPGYAPDAFPGSATTDDRGAYRIFGLAPGEYVVAASVRPPRGNPTVSTDVRQVSRADIQRAEQLLRATGGAAPAAPEPSAASAPVRVDYAPVYYPTSFSAADASTIALGRSEERLGLDIVVRLVPTATVSGVVTLADGTPYWGAQVTLIEAGVSPTGNVSQAARITRSNEDGAFAIAGVGPGRFILRAHASSDGFAGSTDLMVSGSDVSASVVMVPGVTVSGRIVFDGATPPAGERPVWLILSPSPLGGLNWDYKPDGSFTIARVTAGRYRLAVNGRLPEGWTLRSIALDGHDVADETFEVRQGEPVEGIVATLTDRGAEISGRFLDEAGRPAPEYELIVFSADPAYQVPRTRRTQHVRPDINGTFVARNLPAGDYFISAVNDLEEGQWHDPAFLAMLVAAGPVRVTVAEGEKKVQDIRVK